MVNAKLSGQKQIPCFCVFFQVCSYCKNCWNVLPLCALQQPQQPAFSLFAEFLEICLEVMLTVL